MSQDGNEKGGLASVKKKSLALGSIQGNLKYWVFGVIGRKGTDYIFLDLPSLKSRLYEFN